MKTLYLECNMGASGDMLSAALLELHPDPEDFVRRLNHLGLPGVVFCREPSVKCGITGTHLSVTVHGEEEQSQDVPAHETHSHTHSHPHDHGEGHHHHHTLAEITHLVSHLSLPQPVRNNILAVYQLLAQAEGHVHGKSVEEIHFHEVGALDAVADITAVCLLLHELNPERIAASPVQVGSGQVHCAHGILPVPAPAAAWLLQGIPTYSGAIQGELCTPTGAALLRHFVQFFGPQPVMQVEHIGYGMGAKDFPQANCLRAMLGETPEEAESVCELRCNLDDMTPEALGFAMERLLEAGALDVFTTPVGMKKCRPGVLLTVLCREHQREELLRLLFLHTTTLGVRASVCSRYVLTRRTRLAETEAGSVRIKQVSGWGVCREKPEYEDLARIARAQGCSLAQAEALVQSKRQADSDTN
ncbi:MAG: nickel pincer cofactor biosynthesis protein LarC [Candidatus Onthomonas sp.]